MSKNKNYYPYTCINCRQVPSICLLFYPFYYINLSCKCGYQSTLDVKQYFEQNEKIKAINPIDNIMYCKKHINEKYTYFCNYYNKSFCSIYLISWPFCASMHFKALFSENNNFLYGKWGEIC